MIVDSSVWIDHLRDRDTRQVLLLRRLLSGETAGPRELLTADRDFEPMRDHLGLRLAG